MKASGPTRLNSFPGCLPTNNQSIAHEQRNGSLLPQIEVGSSGHHSAVTHKGLCRFLLHHWTTSATLLAGLVCVFGVYGFTAWLSKQHFGCPSWSLNCDINKSVEGIVSRLGLVQGVVTLIFNIGLASLTYTACTLCEVAAWPVLRQQPYALDEFEEFLRASRGSLASLPGTYRSTRSISAALVIFSLTTVLITPLSGSTLVGYAYNPVDVSTHYKYSYWAGGGAGFRFDQVSPPSDRPASIGIATSFYPSWSRVISDEPLPELRNFVLERNNLSRIGNFSVNTVKASIDMNCFGHAVDVQDVSDDKYIFHVWAYGNGTTKERERIRIRVQPVLTTWVDDIQEFGEAVSIVTLIFAVMNGKIEGGQYTNFTQPMKDHGDLEDISAVACQVKVDLVDAVAISGAGGDNRGTVSTLEKLAPPPQGGGTLHDIATWIGIAPTVIGSSTFGAQPMFEQMQSTPLPSISTAYNFRSIPQWTIPELKHFFNVTAGAVMLGIADDFKANTVEISCQQFSTRLDEKRAFVLLVPPVVIIVMTLVLAFWNSRAHHHLDLPTVRLANIGELIRSSQTTFIRDAVVHDLRNPWAPSEFGNTRVQYNFTTPQGIHGFVSPSS